MVLDADEVEAGCVGRVHQLTNVTELAAAGTTEMPNWAGVGDITSDATPSPLAQ